MLLLISKPVLILLVVACCKQCFAVEWPNSELTSVSNGIKNMLNDNLSDDEFERKMLKYARDFKMNFGGVNLRALNEFHKTRVSSFRSPCTLHSARVFDGASALFESAAGTDLQQVFDYLFHNQPIEGHSDKCISQFDELARELFSLNFEARELLSSLRRATSPSDDQSRLAKYEQKVQMQEFMQKLASVVDDASVTSMSFADLQQDFDYFSRHEDQVSALLAGTDYASLCGVAVSSPRLREMNAIMRVLLASNTSLRTEKIIHRLAMQTKVLEPNSVQILSLTIFCDRQAMSKTDNLASSK